MVSRDRSGGRLSSNVDPFMKTIVIASALALLTVSASADPICLFSFLSEDGSGQYDYRISREQYLSQMKYDPLIATAPIAPEQAARLAIASLKSDYPEDLIKKLAVRHITLERMHDRDQVSHPITIDRWFYTVTFAHKERGLERTHPEFFHDRAYDRILVLMDGTIVRAEKVK